MNVLGDPIVFWVLRLLLFAVLFFCGKSISKSKDKSFMSYLWIAILFFALIEGLRWMRGTDYENYMHHFERGVSQKSEPLYNIFISIIHSLSINPTIVFVFISGFLIYGLGINFRNFKVSAIWGLPLIYLLLGYQAENLVRQYLAISFLGLAYYNYYLDKYKGMLTCLAIAPLIHITGILGSFVFLLLVWKKIQLKRVWYVWGLVGVYLAAYFFWDPEWLSQLAFLVGSLNVEDSSQLSVYITNADYHFTEEGSISARAGIEVKQSFINVALYFLTDLAIIIAGFFACRKNEKYILLYLFSYLGILFQVLFGDIQVLMRFGYWFSWMCPFLIALIICFNDYGKYKLFRFAVLFLFFARYAYYGVILQIGRISMEEGCMFIWDK